MSILRKRRKEKLRFRIVNKRVTNKEFKYFKRLFLESLGENSDIEKKLDSYYRRIQIGFSYKKGDPITINFLRDFFKDPSFASVIADNKAFSTSKNGVGYVGLFIKDLQDHIKKWKKHVQNEVYYKNVAFHELCHLVEQKGSYGIHPYPESWITLLNLYEGINRRELGEEVLLELYRVRGHYEVYLMEISAYPREWTEIYWNYFVITPDAYDEKYEKWKQSIPSEIVYGRLITDTLRSINVLYVAEKVPREKLLDKHNELLEILIKTGKLDIENKKSLIERDMGSGALSLIDSLDESIFKTSDVFFAVILDLWKSLRLV
jgi:hypothetical protein